MSWLHVRSVVLFCSVMVSFWSVSVGQTAPTLTMDKKVTTLYQYETGSKALFTATCGTTPNEKACSVSIQNVYPSNPCGNCFAIYPCGDDYCLRFLPGQGFLNPSVVPLYLLTLQAKDEDGLTVRELLDVRITTNSPPYFSYPTMSTLVDVNSAKNVPTGLILTTVMATDDDNDALTFTMVTVPDVDSIAIDSLSGAVRTTQDLRGVCLTTITALIHVQDPRHNPVGPFAVTFNLLGANEPPIVNNLNSVLYVREDQTVGSTVMNLAAFDDNVYPDIAYTVATVPTSAAGLFEIKGNNLKVKSALDYESHRHGITMKIRATDGYCDSQLYTLTIKLVDINEPPVLLPPDQTLESCEGLVRIVPTWNASDPDEGDVVRFTDIQPNSRGRFRIDENSGVVFTTIDYDLDEEKHDETVILTVTLSDRQLFTGTATLTVRFADCNDNAPIFDRPARIYEVEECVDVDTVVGKVPKVTDADSDYQQNNVFSFSGSGAGAMVQPSGSIVITKMFSAGQSLTFPVYATDQGLVPGPLTSKPFWVSIYAVKCTTKAPATQAPTILTTNDTVVTTVANNVDFWDANEGWIIAAGVVGGVLVLLALYMLFKYAWPMCRQSCVRNPASSHRHKSKENGQFVSSNENGQHPSRIRSPCRRPGAEASNERPGPRFPFGWWKESYNDSDYQTMPDRHSMPEPSKGAGPVKMNTYDADPVSTLPPPPSPSPGPQPTPPKKKTCIIL